MLENTYKYKRVKGKNKGSVMLWRDFPGVVYLYYMEVCKSVQNCARELTLEYAAISYY